MRRVCVVTGAAGKLGSRICERLSADYNILGVYHQNLPSQFDSQLVQSFDPLTRETVQCKSLSLPYLIKADLKKADDQKRIVEVCLARFGKIDLLVNAAADIRFYGELKYTWSHLASVQDQLFLNAIAPVLLASSFVDYFWKKSAEQNRQFNRNIINVSSVSGLNVYPGFGQGFYSASKAALNYLTCHLASEYENIAIRANAICPVDFPGTIATEAVVDEIVRLDSSKESGKVFLLDEGGSRATN
ncbi:SDR family oxidoreductase [Bradyrhizobium tropiciagri]|uniref:SDR family NAD(P)-dependent oxidoreductase n=1 Tax=Bradyrhizobium tropiciagri TaxID=312253 RepID=UPI001BA72AEE|nr:SDR family oxidoreductase [Bradyrhizobium tropiciagri]MBR0899586.1 SDR family oxidoreductase [Bradyrhizobium tropiciagri]